MFYTDLRNIRAMITFSGLWPELCLFKVHNKCVSQRWSKDSEGRIHSDKSELILSTSADSVEEERIRLFLDALAPPQAVSDFLRQTLN